MPRQKCNDCYKEGRIYRKQVITDPVVRQKLKTERERLAHKWKEAKARRTGVTKEGRSRRSRSQRERRLFQLRELDRLLSEVLSCFQKDSTGTWQIYNDEFGIIRLRPLLNEIQFLLPKLRKLLSYLPRE